MMIWIALAALALWYLKWRDPEIERNTPVLLSDLLDSTPVRRRMDNLPKPFARLRSPIVTAPRKVPSVAPNRPARLRAEPGEVVPVSVTAYCLKGRTRSGTLTSEGVIAADPRVFPLNSEIVLIVGRDTLGRFRVEDTGLLIKGPKLDIWLESCSEARVFGRKRGKATLQSKIRR